MKLPAIGLCLLAACTGLPPEGTPYFESTTSGGNLYPATQTRVYATDQKIETHEPHPSNDNRGFQRTSDTPGAFADGVLALQTLPNVPVSTVLQTPDACCQLSVARTFSYFDGQTVRSVPEAVWRRSAAIPPFVDEQLFSY